MITLTRKTDYALISMCELTLAGDDAVLSARDIHDQHEIPLPLLMNVLKRLQRAGLLESIRGAKGGYRLARPADRISLAKLIEAVEGPVKLVRCAGAIQDGRRCTLTGHCPARRAMHKLHHHLAQTLQSVTIADLAYDQWEPQRAAEKVLSE